MHLQPAKHSWSKGYIKKKSLGPRGSPTSGKMGSGGACWVLHGTPECASQEVHRVSANHAGGAYSQQGPGSGPRAEASFSPSCPSAGSGRRGEAEEGKSRLCLHPCPVTVPGASARPVIQKGTHRENLHSWLPSLLLSGALRLSLPFSN